jgi:hypothetical protein
VRLCTQKPRKAYAKNLLARKDRARF